MRPRNSLLAISILALATGAGCRLFVDGLAASRFPRFDDFHAAARPLGTDLWRANPFWSPLNELPEMPLAGGDTATARWLHPGTALALEAAENDGAIPSGVRRETESALRRGRPGAPHPDVDAWFATVASADDPIGWNAAILWARYDPTAARESIPVLARLVLQPPTYQPGSSEPSGSGLRDMEFDRASGKLTPAQHPKPVASKPAIPVEISPNMRLAAAEAWCLVLAAAHTDPEMGLAPAGRALDDPKLPARIKAELMLGIARFVSPDRIPGLASALNDDRGDSPRATDARRVAAEACVVHGVQRRLRGAVATVEAATPEQPAGDDPEALALAIEGDSPWPKSVWWLRNDHDPRLRARLGELVAVIRHPAALAVLKAQLNDVDTHVRESALVNLGLLGTAAARGELALQSKRPDERPRELAVRALACDGPAAVAAFVGDKSAKVRLEVARSAVRRPSSAAARLVRDLLMDSSLEVQMACIESIRDWPESLATPILLESLASSAFKTRQAALMQLEDRRGGGLAFPLLAGPQERALRVAQWGRQWSVPDAAVERVHELTQQGSPLLDEARLADLRDRLHGAGAPGSTEAVARVAGWAGELTAADLPLVERLLDETDALQSDVLLHHVLPRLSPAWGTLIQLEKAEPAARRQGAAELARLGQDASLSRAICRRLQELMKTEQDNLVWRFVMLAVIRDGSEEAARLALLAINNPWPDVRILGCEYVGRHGQSEQAAWLLPVFYESNRAVQLSAVTAAGKCGNPIVLDGLPAATGRPPLRGLRPLLTESQGQIQFAVISSMSRLGDLQAMQELVRMALDVNSTSRLDVVQTMGETGQTRFVEPLIRLAWTEANHHVREAALASLKQLVRPAEQPPALARSRNVADAVEIWAAWWEDRRQKWGS